MPANNGRKPPFDMVDVKLRCGVVVRDTPSDQWRWKPWPDGESGGDVISWQPAGLLKKWQSQNK